jgi:SEC-C motif domain protein
MARTPDNQPCPCGGVAYEQCCGRFIGGGDVAQTAEQLMRSRYTAYTRRNDAYLKATWHADTRPDQAVAPEDDTRWLGLEVRRHVPGIDAAAVDTATVEFVARYKIGGRAHRLHEVSRFVREDGKWYYVNGSFPETK